MTPYRIDLHDATGCVSETRTDHFAQDDDAIDHAGGLEHPHEINIWQDDRHVARFLPIVRRL